MPTKYENMRVAHGKTAQTRRKVVEVEHLGGCLKLTDDASRVTTVFLAPADRLRLALDLLGTPAALDMARAFADNPDDAESLSRIVAMLWSTTEGSGNA
jgi:hypothetical protein